MTMLGLRLRWGLSMASARWDRRRVLRASRPAVALSDGESARKLASASNSAKVRCCKITPPSNSSAAARGASPAVLRGAARSLPRAPFAPADLAELRAAEALLLEPVWRGVRVMWRSAPLRVDPRGVYQPYRRLKESSCLKTLKALHRMQKVTLFR